MNRPILAIVAAFTATTLIHTSAAAQGHPPLHVSSRWKECSFQLDAALTQGAWRQFTHEAALVAYFRPLAGAEPMGRGRYEITMMRYTTGIDDHDPAWNDTFVHPDSAHWLFEGSGLSFPGLAARVGVTDQTDLGLYFTRNPNANYGFIGAQLQRSVLASPTGAWTSSARVSYSRLFGPDDLTLSVVGIDLVGGRRVSIARWVTLSPYVGVSTFVASSHERSPVVTLTDERVLGTQGMVGAALQVSGLRIAAEYNVSRVNSMSLKIGVGR